MAGVNPAPTYILVIIIQGRGKPCPYKNHNGGIKQGRGKPCPYHLPLIPYICFFELEPENLTT